MAVDDETWHDIDHGQDLSPPRDQTVLILQISHQGKKNIVVLTVCCLDVRLGEINFRKALF
jgi:hypothetical protein